MTETVREVLEKLQSDSFNFGMTVGFFVGFILAMLFGRALYRSGVRSVNKRWEKGDRHG